MLSTPSRLVLFDVDGTLVDSQNLIYAATIETARRLGRPAPDRAFALAGVGLSLEPGMRRLFDAGDDDDFVALAARTYREAFHDLRADPAHHEPLFPGAAAAVDRLSRDCDVVLGVVTGKSRRGVAHIFDRFDWHNTFATIQTADDAPSKPHPAMVEQAAAETGIAVQRAVVIGDTSFDMRMAVAAGARAIGVSWGNHGVSALRDAGAALILDDFAALPAALDQLWQET